MVAALAARRMGRSRPWVESVRNSHAVGSYEAREELWITQDGPYCDPVADGGCEIRTAMPRVDVVRHFETLRRSLEKAAWLMCADVSTISLFNKLLVEAQQIATEHTLLQSLKPQRVGVSPRSLLTLADQVLTALA